MYIVYIQYDPRERISAPLGGPAAVRTPHAWFWRGAYKVPQVDIIISNSSGKPIYEQIADQVKEQIMAGALAAGDALPSMRLLAKELRISVITTKRAYEELERDGFLENVPGKGCFVAPQNRELLREAQLRRVEEKLTQAIEEARRGAVSLEELKEMLTELYQEV